jgi:hypothetical protein
VSGAFCVVNRTLFVGFACKLSMSKRISDPVHWKNLNLDRRPTCHGLVNNQKLINDK